MDVIGLLITGGKDAGSKVELLAFSGDTLLQCHLNDLPDKRFGHSAVLCIFSYKIKPTNSLLHRMELCYVVVVVLTQHKQQSHA